MAGGLKSTFQIGANSGQNISVNIGAMDASSLGVAGQITSQGATTAVGGVTYDSSWFWTNCPNIPTSNN